MPPLGANLWVCIPSTCMSPLAALASRFIINVACFCAELLAFPLHLVWKKKGMEVLWMFSPCLGHACIKVCRRGRLRRAAPHCRLLRTSAVDPEDTSMCSLEGWRVSLFSTSSSMFWLFPPLPGAFVGDLAMCERKWMRGAWGRSQLLFSMG